MVKSRVVATAAHVVFDDGTLSAAVGLQWLFQRDRGTYEPKPQIPRGSYVFSGYATQRISEATPGEASPASQELDAAALYFLEDAGRGGFGGFLASDSANNEWLLSPALKMLVGYPVNGVPAANQGRMHATPPANVTLAPAFGHTYTTAAVTSAGGNSGGPLCVQFEGGNYYAAAIYLGGSAQTVVRAIDSGVIDLFTRAEVSGNGGSDNTGGGITQVNAPASAGNFVASALRVELTPIEAANAGARWKLSANGTEYAGHTQLNGPPPGNYTVSFKPVSGFLTPAPLPVTLLAGQLKPLTQSYGEFLPPTITSAMLADAIRGESYNFHVAATQSPASYTATGLAAIGLQISASGQITGIPVAGSSGPHAVTITATNAAGSASKDFTLQVREPGQLVLQFDPTRGNVTGKPKTVGLGSSVLGQGTLETLTATVKSPNSLFTGWTLADVVTGAAPVPSANPKLTFTMTQSVVATANFIANPFPDFADRYLGRIAPLSDVTLANSGMLDVQVTKLGQITGKLLFGAKSYPVKGQLLPDGTAQVTIKRRSLTNGDLVLQLTLDLSVGGSEQITGTLMAALATLPVSLDRTVFDAKTNPYPQAALDPKTGKPVPAQYTVALQRDPTKPANQFPQGHGFGVATVNPDGTVRFTGTLGDGTAVAQSSVVSKTGAWPFHALLYQKLGMLTGDLTFREITSVSDLDGTLDWIKPPLTGATVTYPAGFTPRTSVIGARYDKTVPVPNSTVTLGEGNLGVILHPVLVSRVAGLLTASPPVPGYSLQMTQATGFFKGTLPAAAALKPLKFQGAIFQKTQCGYGWFLGAPLPAGLGLPTGYVELHPTP